MLLPVFVWTLVTAIASHALAQPEIVISEFMASNTRTLQDEDGDYEDWIELRNVSTARVNLDGWYLTDNRGNLTKWRFPGVLLDVGAYLVVFASGKDRQVPGQSLHTNFRLSQDGEFLALIKPDGATVATEFAPAYPGQLTDVSYGFGLMVTNLALISTSAPVRVLVPSVSNGGANLGDAWKGGAEPFNDAGWMAAVNGVGFGRGSNAPLVAPTSMVVRFEFDAPPLNGTNVVDTKPFGIPHPGVSERVRWVETVTENSQARLARAGVMNFLSTETNRITIAPHTDFNVPEGTISFWMLSGAPGGPGSQGAMLFGRRSPSAGLILLQADDGRLYAEAISGPGTVQVRNALFSDRTVSDNLWHHVACTFSQAAGGTIAFYIDGQPSGVATNSAVWFWSTTFRIDLGRSYLSTWRAFNGSLDGFRMDNRILAPAEIMALAALETDVPTNDLRTVIRDQMQGVNASAFVRIPFVVSNPSAISLLQVRLQYDDGFVAWINGREIARGHAPEPLSWNSAATGQHASSVPESIALGVGANLLHAGTNILSIQGLNLSASDSTFLIRAQLTGTSFPAETSSPLYFPQPTPGRDNTGGATTPGPIISAVTHSPNVPLDNEDLLVTARVEPSFRAVASVTLRYRVMFNGEASLTMFDDGLHGDGARGDGVFGASIPAAASTGGQMVRYYILATDAQGNRARWPLFADPAGSAEYLGTVVNPDYVTSKIPIFHFFIASGQMSGIDSETGGRVSFFHDGEFYDNIHMEVRGNTTTIFGKKSHRLEFNREHRLRHPGPGGRIRRTSLMADYIDPTYLRQGLTFWLLNAAGTPASFYYPVRLQLNGQFYQLANHNELLGEEQLERFGLDPNGALYKEVGSVVVGRTGDKLSREWEGPADIQALTSAMSEALSLNARRTNAYDMLDLPNVINYVACARWLQEGDEVQQLFALQRFRRNPRVEKHPFRHELHLGPALLARQHQPHQYRHGNRRCLSRPSFLRRVHHHPRRRIGALQSRF